MLLPMLTNGALLVTPEFLKNGSPELYVEPATESIGEGDQPEFEALREALRLATGELQASDERAASDAAAAPAVHQALKLTRREAARPQFWHYCTVVECRDYVAWRWGGHDRAVAVERYLGQVRRNALARLWWLAELTTDQADADPYALTRLAASHSELSQWTLDSVQLSACREVLDCLIRTCAHEPNRDQQTIRTVFKQTMALRATRVLEYLPAHIVQSELELFVTKKQTD